MSRGSNAHVLFLAWFIRRAARQAWLRGKFPPRIPASQYRILHLYSTANDPKTANDLQNGPQMILDRKWSPKSTANDPVKNWGWEWILWDWLQKRTDYNWKEPNFLAPYNEKGKGDATSQVNLYKAKKNVINLKRIWYQPYTFSFVNCFKFLSIMFRRCKNLRQTGRVEKKLYYFSSIILTPRSSTCLLRNTKPVTLYTTRALLIDFTDLFGSVELIFRIFNFYFSMKC